MKGKLITAFAALLFIFGLSGWYSISQLSEIRSQIHFQNERVDEKQHAYELKASVQSMNNIFAGYIISRNEELAAAYNKEKATFLQQVEQLVEKAESAEERKASQQLKTVSTEFVGNFDRAKELLGDKTLAPNFLNNELIRVYQTSEAHQQYIFELVDGFVSIFSAKAEASIAASEQLISDSSRVSQSSIVVVMIIAAAIGFLIIRSFIRQIQSIQQSVEQLALGDFRAKINARRKDELGRLSDHIDHMADRISSMMVHTKQIASSLQEQATSFHQFTQAASGSHANIVNAMEEISMGANQQAVQADRSASSVHELGHQLHEVKSFANMVKQSEKEVSSSVNTGSETIRQLQESAEHSDQEMAQVGSSLSELLQASQQIGGIIRAITDISNQTNVLALNAAIEAARAGQHGRGFSVIAEEVRALSVQTNQSSKSVSKTIEQLQQQIELVGNRLEGARSSLQTQNSLVHEAHRSFDAIWEAVNAIGTQIDEVDQRMDTALKQNERFVDSLQQVAAIAEETAAGVEEITSTTIEQNESVNRVAHGAARMNQMAAELFSELERFQLPEEQGIDTLEEKLQPPTERMEPHDSKAEEGKYEDASLNTSDAASDQLPAEDKQEERSDEEKEASMKAAEEPSADGAESQNQDSKKPKELVSV
ncbi:methyl-accepting chemotaxis protein [Paenibacillus turpanensis]|uniref:methyl-accepting chemotaxis protein n=1 Tax=Paenibacillus turpanensis TaxID=2689078 RepID=UPI001407EAED|nr:methyl-accepting chemotaxis protein [Paenibacillus turpanensis]